MNDQIKRLNARLAELKLERQSYDTVWADIIDHCAPDLKGYINPGAKQDGKRNDERVFDKAPERAALGCASGLYAGISSPARAWANLTMRKDALDAQPGVRAWLDEEMSSEYEVMSLSNFYQALFTAYLHLTVIGTACVLMLPDYDDVIRCEALNVGSFWLGIDNKGRVDTLYWEFFMSSRNIVETFEGAPQQLRDNIKGGRGSETPHKIIGVIEPNRHNLAPFQKHKYAVAYYLESGNDGKFLEVGGFEVFPVLAPRWFTNHNETYGKFNPGRVALGDMKQLQTMVDDFNEAMQKVVDPPMQAPQDVNENGQVATYPGAVNTFTSMDKDMSLKPLYQVNPDLAAQWQAINEKKEQISQLFFIDLFMAISMRSGKDMTAEEVRALAGERMLMLGPAFGNLDRELLTPAIELLFYYRSRAGLVQQPPEEAAGEVFRPEYISTLAQAQKMLDVNRISNLLSTVIGLSQANPEVLDKVDFDAAVDHTDKMLAAPAGIIRGNEEVRKIREARAMAVQQQQMAAAAIQTAESAKTLAQAPVGGQQKNALDSIMQGMGVQQ